MLCAVEGHSLIYHIEEVKTECVALKMLGYDKSRIDISDKLISRLAMKDLHHANEAVEFCLKKGIDRLAAAEIENTSLSNYNALVAVAAETGYIAEADIKKLEAFQKNPSDESWITG